MDRTCNFCRFWDNGEGDELDEGECRRYPPVLVPLLMSTAIGSKDNAWSNAREAAECPTSWRHPVVCFDHWCGEFQPPEADQETDKS